MDMFDLSEIVVGGDEAVTTEMQRNRLLRTHVQCQPYGRQFYQIRKKGSMTGFVFLSWLQYKGGADDRVDIGRFAPGGQNTWRCCTSGRARPA